MKDFIVSARKYRPDTFKSVVGQDHITTTLKNALRSNQLAQAFLFTGTRGVGKTTCARILAKTINCKNVSEDYEPCNQCDSCKDFNEGKSFNIHELDAASNNSVEDIRALTEKVRFAPQSGKFSVYIIDEVHMLSQAAFNAFLKTLEEPPSFVKFILATTDKHKILPTILSRCQIFDFNRITIVDIVNHLKYVAQSENISAEEEALHIIAQRADGAMRDALSIFDQIANFSNNEITYNSVIANLNMLDYNYYFNIVQNLFNNDLSNILVIYDEILGSGFEGNHFINGLADHFRNILLAKDVATLKLLETSPKNKERYNDLASQASKEQLIKVLDILNKSDVQYKIVTNKRLHVELAMLQICQIFSTSQASEEKKKSEVAESKSPEKIVAESASKPVPVVPTASATPVSPVVASTPTPTSIVVTNTNPSSSEANSTNKVTPKMAYKPKTSISVVSENVGGQADAALSKDGLGGISSIEETFDEISLRKYWSLFADDKKSVSQLLYLTLTNSLPELRDGFMVEYTLENSVQETQFKEVSTELLSYLKEHLKNNKVNINLLIKPSDKPGYKPYTSKDKYAQMLEKNKSLESLKLTLGMELL